MHKQLRSEFNWANFQVLLNRNPSANQWLDNFEVRNFNSNSNSESIRKSLPNLKLKKNTSNPKHSKLLTNLPSIEDRHALTNFDQPITIHKRVFNTNRKQSKQSFNNHQTKLTNFNNTHAAEEIQTPVLTNNHSHHSLTLLKFHKIPKFSKEKHKPKCKSPNIETQKSVDKNNPLITIFLYKQVQNTNTPELKKLPEKRLLENHFNNKLIKKKFVTTNTTFCSPNKLTKSNVENQEVQTLQEKNQAEESSISDRIEFEF